MTEDQNIVYSVVNFENCQQYSTNNDIVIDVELQNLLGSWGFVDQYDHLKSK